MPIIVNTRLGLPLEFAARTAKQKASQQKAAKVSAEKRKKGGSSGPRFRQDESVDIDLDVLNKHGVSGVTHSLKYLGKTDSGHKVIAKDRWTGEVTVIRNLQPHQLRRANRQSAVGDMRGYSAARDRAKRLGEGILDDEE